MDYYSFVIRDIRRKYYSTLKSYSLPYNILVTYVNL